MTDNDHRNVDPIRSAACALALALALVFIDAGCGGSGGNTGTVVPIDTVCVPTGFGSVQFDLVCPAGAGGFDGLCTYVLQSSNTGVVTISPSVVVVPENQSLHVVLTTIGNRFGSSILSGRSDNGASFDVGRIQVGC